MRDDSLVYQEAAKEIEASRSPAGEYEQLLQNLTSGQGVDADKPLEVELSGGAGEYAKQAAGGALDAVQEIGNTAIDLADWAENYAAKKGYGSGDLIPDDYHMTWAEDAIPRSKDLGPSLTRGLANFLLPFGAAMKGIKVAKNAGPIAKFMKGAVTGAAVDFAAFDPRGERLSNLLQRYPELQNPVFEYLAADPKDSRAEGRFKQTLEGMGIGAVLGTGLTLAAKGYRALRGAGKGAAEAAAKEGAEAAAKTVDPDMAKALGAEGAATVDPKKVPPPAQVLKPVEPPKVTLNPDAKVPEKAANINLLNINTEDDVKKVWAEIAQHPTVKAEIDAARRGVVSDAQVLKEVAENFDMTPEKLMERRAGQAFSAEELLKTRILTTAAAEDVFKKMEKVAAGGSQEDKANLVVAFNKFRAIQMQYTGAVAESGRALRILGMKVGTENGPEKGDVIRKLIETYGGDDAIEAMANHMRATVKGMGNKSKALARIANKSTGMKLLDAAIETRAAGLVSSPSTWAINAISNSVAVATRPVERAFAAGLSAMRSPKAGQEAVRLGEVMATITPGWDGLVDSLRVGYSALKTGQPSSMFNKVDRTGAFSAEAFNAHGAVGAGIDMVGKTIGLAFRPLMAADEFFKSIIYRTEVKAQAIRKAASLGLEGKELNAFIKDQLQNPSAEIHLRSYNEALANTYTKPLEGRFRQINNLVQSHPVGRTLFMFSRIGLSLLDYTIERTPLAPMLRHYTDDIAKGGHHADIARSKIMFGTSVMGTSAYLTANGMMTGSGPLHPEAQKTAQRAGFVPHAIKIGDSWFPYKKLGPIGEIMALGANAAELLAHTSAQFRQDREVEITDLISASGAAIADFITPEYWVETMGTVLEAIDRGNPKVLENFLASQAASFVPYSGAARFARQQTDPYKRSMMVDPESTMKLADLTWNRIRNGVPILSSKMPYALDIFGDKIKYDPKFVFSGSDAIVDPIKKEMLRLQLSGKLFNTDLAPGEQDIAITMPPQVPVIAGTPTELSPEMYQEFTELCAGIGTYDPRGTMKDFLNRVVEGKFVELGPYSTNDEHRRRFIKQTIREYREAAKGILVQRHPELLNSIGQYQDLKARLETVGRPQEQAFDSEDDE